MLQCNVCNCKAMLILRNSNVKQCEVNTDMSISFTNTDDDTNAMLMLIHIKQCQCLV